MGYSSYKIYLLTQIDKLTVNLSKVYIFSIKKDKLAQAALRAPPKVMLQCVAGHCYNQLSVFFFFLSLVSPSFASDPLRGNSRVRRYIQKKYLFLVILILLRKKADIRAFFRHFTASVRSQPPGPPAVPGVLRQNSLTATYISFEISLYFL